MQLHLCHGEDGDELCCLDDVYPVIPWKICDDMRTLPEAIASDAERGIYVFRDTVAAADLLKGMGIAALQPQLDRHILAIGI